MLEKFAEYHTLQVISLWNGKVVKHLCGQGDLYVRLCNAATAKTSGEQVKIESSSDENDKHFMVSTSQKRNKPDKSQQGSTHHYSQPGPSSLPDNSQPGPNRRSFPPDNSQPGPSRPPDNSQPGPCRHSFPPDNSQPIGVKHQGGAGGQGSLPQYFTLKTLLIFIHATQIAAIVVYITFSPPKMQFLPTPMQPGSSRYSFPPDNSKPHPRRLSSDLPDDSPTHSPPLHGCIQIKKSV